MTANTNGASLEDCLTNIFSLIDLNGLRWKRYKLKENTNCLHTPIDTHPILTTYAKCTEENYLAVWRHEPPKRHSSAGAGVGPNSATGTGSLNHSNFPTPTRASNNNTPTCAGPTNPQSNLSNINNQHNNLELWIFGYSHQLKVGSIIGEDLVETEDETWESKGLSYECRTLLFKALHNLIEKCLISKGYTKLGRWFVQPSSNIATAHSSLSNSLDQSTKSSVAFSFSFFVHGDSTICATTDVRNYPNINPLTKQDLTSFHEGNLVRVILAPHGLNGVLNGISHRDGDNGVATSTFLKQWSKFFPLPKTLARLGSGNLPTSAMSSLNQKTSSSSSNLFNQANDSQPRSYLSNLTNMLVQVSQKPSNSNHESNDPPPIVEVIVAGQRMRYPSECVFTTSKLVDPYKNPVTLPTSRSKLPTTSAKRTYRNNTSSKANKLSLLNDKQAEERFDPGRVKTELDQGRLQSNPTSVFKLTSSDSNSKFSTKLDAPQSKQQYSMDNLQHKNSGFDADYNTSLNSMNSQKPPISRYTPSKVGLGLNNSSLGPADLVKLFPTPPSLEQNILSPQNAIEEATSKDAIVHQSPATSTNVSTHCLKDNRIDVYKPVECFVMQPPPKWAALTNIIVPNSRLLPPECIYKASPQKSKIASPIGPNETIKGSQSTPMKTSIKISTKMNCSIPPQSPLTDQTNKNGFNQSPSKANYGTSLLDSSIPSAMSVQATNPTATSSFSTFSLPHQILFNNLTEINPIQLNLMLSDSVISMNLDHNFESCTLCVCNMSIKGTHFDTIPQKDHSNNWKTSVSHESSSNEFVNECTCGFSAIVTRHRGHMSGLFYEDELELTNLLYDPTEMIDQNKLFRKLRLSSYSDNSCNDERRLIAKFFPESSSVKTADDLAKLMCIDEKTPRGGSLADDDVKVFIIDQLKQQCASTLPSNSSLYKVIMIEAFRNNRHLTSCNNYYAQAPSKTSPSSPLHSFLDENSRYTTVKVLNRNPISLRFSDLCEITKGVIIKMANQVNSISRSTSSLVKPLNSNSMMGSSLAAIFSRKFGFSKSPILSKPSDLHGSRNNIFVQGLQALVLPTLTVDPKGALQMLEYLVKDESKEALATLNKAILLFSSPLHDWQFSGGPVPENNLDVATLLKSIQPLLYDSVGIANKIYKDYVHQQQQHLSFSRDSPSGAPTVPTPPCQGPLTWRQFHQAAGRGTEDQCEPQPIPSLLVGHHAEKSHLAISPFALKFWDKLLLEPCFPGHNMHYLVIAPDNKGVMTHVRSFFRELSNMYELMKLGKHTPIGNGLLTVENVPTDDGTEDRQPKQSILEKQSKSIMSQLKNYSSRLNSNLSKAIVEFLEERQPAHDPLSDRFDYLPSSNRTNFHSQEVKGGKSIYRQAFSQLFGSSQTESQPQEPSPQTAPTQSLDNHLEPVTPNPVKSQPLISSSNHGYNDDQYSDEEIGKQSGLVIYMIDPFSFPSLNQNLRTLATIGLFKCYSSLIENLPEHIRRMSQLQMVSLDCIINHSLPMINISRLDQLKSLSLNVYSRCKKIMTSLTTAKSLTGFGPSAAMEAFLKTKNSELCTTKVHSPPFILAPTKDKQTELGEMFGDRREKSSILFCSYCITEDQRWLLASITNERGEMSETSVININISERTKRPKASVKRIALRKLMEFIISVLSDWVNPWRLIVGKLGRLGHGELREWASLLSKRSLLNYSRHLVERCRQCTILPPTETVTILSACLVSLEPDSKLRIMPDQFTSDDRQASFNKCPLSTPEDASATHILVFPTSAFIQSSHGIVEDPLANSGLDDDLLNQFPLEDDIEDLGVEENMDDLFSAWDDNQANSTEHINAHHDTMMSSSNLQSGSVGDNANNQDETLQLLQQPLALGYYISTAKIGQMPSWFWSTSPHLRNSCPVFLKSALHIHVPCVQLSDDLLHSGVGQSRKSHQLDSNLTTDVLRYVLEGYNSLSWLALNSKTYDRQSCLPVHMQNLLQLYHVMESFS